MEFMKRFDLNFVCRVFEWLAIIVFCLGIFISLIMAIITTVYGNFATFWGTIIAGTIYSFLSAVFFLFISRIGDAIDDIRNKICFTDNETE